MSRVIWKYTVPVDDLKHTFTMKAGAEIVEVGAQRIDEVAFWALCDPGPHTPPEVRTFTVLGTGHYAPDDWEYRGTVNLGALVWHLFEVTGP